MCQGILHLTIFHLLVSAGLINCAGSLRSLALILKLTSMPHRVCVISFQKGSRVIKTMQDRLLKYLAFPPTQTFHRCSVSEPLQPSNLMNSAWRKLTSCWFMSRAVMVRICSVLPYPVYTSSINFLLVYKPVMEDLSLSHKRHFKKIFFFRNLPSNGFTFKSLLIFIDLFFFFFLHLNTLQWAGHQ